MIPRHQIIILILLLVASVAMGGMLWNLRERAHRRLLRGQDSAPTQAPEVAPAVQATLMVANDADNSVTERVLALPLPQSPEARAKAVLGKLFDLYAAPEAAHRAPGGADSIEQVFLLPLAGSKASKAGSAAANSGGSSAGGVSESGGAGPQLAIVNLNNTFVSDHPSGLETESLTILSICATLHANLPEVAQVRFLVDGQPRATLAGHADLTRTYLTSETIPTEGAHP